MSYCTFVNNLPSDEPNVHRSYHDTQYGFPLDDDNELFGRLKVNAAIENARAIQHLQAEYGSFQNWLAHHHPQSREAWVGLFKKTFKFTGGEIVNEFLMSTGWLPGAHDPDCPVFLALRKI